MNFIQTLYIDDNKDPFRDSFGWVAPEYHLMGWALSCLQLHKIYGDISLFANTSAAHLLIDTLQLPYSAVNLTHDRLRLAHPDLWAFPKIYTYSLQEQPFLHIDGDVFLFQPFSGDLLEGELIAQNVEIAADYDTIKRELGQYFTFFPPCVKKDFESEIPVHAVCAGILGGKNSSFFRDYTASAFDYIHKNADSLKHINVNRFNVFYEQHLFYSLAREYDIPVSVLFKGIVNDNEYRFLGDFHDVPFNRSYLHLLGHFKRDEFTCIRMAAKLRELYPDYYDRIVALFHDRQIRLSPSGFKNGENPLSREDNSHLQRLVAAAEHCPPEIEKELFKHDFELFFRQLESLLEKESGDLRKKDMAAQHWCRDLFADPFSILNHHVVRSRETEIIESSFDWAGLFNKQYRVGTDYYSDLQIDKGCFYNLIVRENSDNGFSLYDINELEHAMLLLLSEPMPVSEVLTKMEVYFEDDVLHYHYEAYKELILASLKQLVIKKAIQPA